MQAGEHLLGLGGVGWVQAGVGEELAVEREHGVVVVAVADSEGARNGLVRDGLAADADVVIGDGVGWRGAGCIDRLAFDNDLFIVGLGGGFRLLRDEAGSRKGEEDNCCDVASGHRHSLVSKEYIALVAPGVGLDAG